MMNSFRSLVGLAALSVLCPHSAFADSALPWVFHAAATATGPGNAISADYFSTVAVQIEGTFVGTVVFEKKAKDATGYVLVQCTNTTDQSQTTDASEPGYWECPGGANSFQARVAVYTSGTIRVTGGGTTAVSRRSGSGLGGWPSLSSDKDINWADSQANAAGVLNSSGDGSKWYTDPTTGPQSVSVCGGIINNCDYYRKLAAGKKAGYRNASDAVKWEFDEATGKVSAMTMHCGDAGVVCQSYRRLAGCGGDLVGVDPTTATAGHIWNMSPTATAPTAVALIGTNVTTGVARHPNADGTYGVQLPCRLPPNVTIGQVDGVLTWTSAGSGNYRPQVKTKCYADNASPDAAFNTAQPFTVAAGTATNVQIDTLSNITMTGCAAGDILIVELVRSRQEASDTGSAEFDVRSFELWATITE